MKKRTLPLLLFASLLIMSIAMMNVSAAADSGTLVPSSASGLVDTPIPFKCTGLIAGTSYSTEIDDVVQQTGLVATSAGEISFDIVISSSGVYTLEVVNSTGGSAGVVASASVRVSDLVETIMPYIILMVTLSIVFGVVAKIKL